VLISVATPISTGRRVVGQVNIRRSMAGLTPQGRYAPLGANPGSPKGFRGLAGPASAHRRVLKAMPCLAPAVRDGGIRRHIARGGSVAG
jgi:hypothetical protein